MTAIIKQKLYSWENCKANQKKTKLCALKKRGLHVKLPKMLAIRLKKKYNKTAMSKTTVKSKWLNVMIREKDHNTDHAAVLDISSTRIQRMIGQQKPSPKIFYEQIFKNKDDLIPSPSPTFLSL